MVIEKASIDAEVARLSRLRTQHIETQFRLRTQVRHQNEELPRLEKRLEQVRSDIAMREDTHGDAFLIQIDGQIIRERGIAGELLLRFAERIRSTHADRLVGQFAGFQVFVAHNFMSGADIVLKGAGTHLAKVGSTALGTIRSVEYAVQNLEEVAVTVEQSIAETGKRIADMQVQTSQAFEYEERLATLSRRQDEIEAALDLTKGQAAPQLEAETAKDNEDAKNDERIGEIREESPESTSQQSLLLGRTFITANAKQVLHPQEVLAALWRHARADWADCSKEGSAQNETALTDGPPLSSTCTNSGGTIFRITTECDRRVTTISLAAETDFSELDLVDAWVCGFGCRNCGG